jgi:hypothetical protein
MTTDCFRVDDRVTILPVVHRSGNHARAVERWLLDRPIDCLAVALPPSFFENVMACVETLPTICLVAQLPSLSAKWSQESTWSENDDSEVDSDEQFPYSFVPIDPCQSFIAAIRFALGERIAIRFVDAETPVYVGEDNGVLTPDCYALSQVTLEAFSTSLLPSIPPPRHPQVQSRIRAMAARLAQLRSKFQNIVMLCDIAHWPWLRDTYSQLIQNPSDIDSFLEPESEEEDLPAINYNIAENTLVFALGELPYLTSVFEHTRQDWDSQLSESSIEGIKRLLLSARSSYMADFGKRSRRISPFLISQCLKYIRNLSLIEGRLTPDMYTIVLAAKQVVGDQFAIHVAETIRNYAFQESGPWETVKMGVSQSGLAKIELPDGSIVSAISRLGQDHSEWKSLELNRRPLKDQSREWKKAWNPYQQCSWLPEDAKIESFRTRVIERAKSIMGADLARSEKFTTSLMDGLDMRETLRHWYDGQLYVKIQPPSVGTLDACVLMFDSSPDPNTYTWRTTWFAECEWESTLAFFATDFRNEMLGPGIAVANYGGALFLYPPRHIEDIWEDEDLQFADTLEDRLIAAACKHSEAKQVALLSPTPPTVRWRQIAKQFGKALVHVPMAQFSDAKIAELRTVHVLNGKQVRSYAAHFIRQS